MAEKIDNNSNTIKYSIRSVVMYNLIGLILTLVISEIGLRIFTRFPAFEKSGHTVPHDVLGRVIDSSFPEIDSDGFRNPHSSLKPEIVTLGDSFTYGYNVESNSSWPQQLGKLATRSVYNYGIGGYGPMHYSWLIDKAIAKSPQWILIGIHLPNDINDVCKVFSFPSYWLKWALSNKVDITRCNIKSEQATESKTPSSSTAIQDLKLIIRKTAIGSALGTLVVDRLNDLLSRKDLSGNIMFVDGRNDFYISKEFNVYTANNSDLNKPELQFAAELAEKAFIDMRDKATAQNIKLGVVFIPSKQSVFQRYLEKAGQKLPAEFIQVIENEAILERRFEAQLDRAGIPWVNTRQGLVDLLEVQFSVYPFRDDDHPLAPGYAAIAKAAYHRFFVNSER